MKLIISFRDLIKSLRYILTTTTTITTTTTSKEVIKK